MSDQKARLTITVDPNLRAYAEHLVESGRTTSVSAALNEAMAEKAYPGPPPAQPVEGEKREQADPVRVARMLAHIDQQLGW